MKDCKVDVCRVSFRRKKGKGKNASAESRQSEDASQEGEGQQQEGESNQTGIDEPPNDGEHEGITDSTRAAGRPVMLTNASSQTTLVSCTPLNTPSHFYGTTPLNTAVSSPPTQRMPVVLGFVSSPLTQAASVPSPQPTGNPSTIVHSGRIHGASSFGAGERNNGVRRDINASTPSPLNSQAVNSQGSNLSTISAQQLQQVVISRMLAPIASESTDVPFLPPMVSSPPSNPNPPPRASILLPHVHSLLNPPGMSNTGGEVTVWPFAPNSNMFQQ